MLLLSFLLKFLTFGLGFESVFMFQKHLKACFFFRIIDIGVEFSVKMMNSNKLSLPTAI